MSFFLQCLSHTPLVGHFDPDAEVIEEVNNAISKARYQIEQFDPQLVVLFAPDHFNGFFFDVMPPYCLGVNAHAIGDFGSAAGVISVAGGVVRGLAEHLLDSDFDATVSQSMQVDHGFAQPLDFLLGGLAGYPVVPIFVNAVAQPLPTMRRMRLLGAAIGRYLKTLNKRVLFIGSGGLSHQPPVPDLETANEHIRERLLGGGRNLPVSEREARTGRVIEAAKRFSEDQNHLHPLNPKWDQYFINQIASARLDALDALPNADISSVAGKSAHEVKTWVAAAAAAKEFGEYRTTNRFYKPIPEWIAGFGILGASAP